MGRRRPTAGRYISVTDPESGVLMEPAWYEDGEVETIVRDARATLAAIRAATPAELDDLRPGQRFAEEVAAMHRLKSMFDATILPPDATPSVPLPDPAQNMVGKAPNPDRDVPETSGRAALRVLPRSGSQRFRVLETIAGAGALGATDDEVEATLGLRSQSVTPRRLELVEQGWVEDSGRRRPTQSGAPAAVWVLTREGEVQWKQRTAT